MKARRLVPALLGATVWATANLVGCISVTATAAASPGPQVRVSTRFATIGQLVQITGAGWSPVGQTVQLELCGQNALNLSTDCDQTNEYSAAIRAGGIFYGALTVRLPPSPCPCVVAVANESGLSAVDVPITIIGAPVVAIPPQPAPVAPVRLSAKVLTPMSVASWFGGPKKVTLVLRVTNLSPIAYESPALSVNVGKGPNPSGFVLGRPLARLAVGATEVLRIPVTLPAITAGRYSVQAKVVTGQGEVATVVRTSSYPWGLFVVAALIIQAGLLLIRNRVRARLGRAPGPPSTTDADPVVDLRTPALTPAGGLDLRESPGSPDPPATPDPQPGVVDLTRHPGPEGD